MKEVEKYITKTAVQLEEFYQLATISLNGITDKVGNPMAQHALEIADYFWKHEGDFYKAAIASLHDVLEDSEIITNSKTLKTKIEEIKFGTTEVKEVKEKLLQLGHEPDNLLFNVDLIVDAVQILTRKKSMTYFQYINYIKKSGNKDAIDVKVADIEHHLETKANIPSSLIERYEKALDILDY
tara:strand:+ start:93 stop:641 length:549 start_codon:yes stop_codon:yes gene_type:complete